MYEEILETEKYRQRISEIVVKSFEVGEKILLKTNPTKGGGVKD